MIPRPPRPALRAIFPLAAAAALAACAPMPPPPACAQTEVLLLVAERLERAGQGQIIEPGSVGQAPGPIPGRLRCAARIRTATYDTNHYGPAPVIAVNVVRYNLELRRKSIFLLPEDASEALTTHLPR